MASCREDKSTVKANVEIAFTSKDNEIESG